MLPPDAADADEAPANLFPPVGGVWGGVSVCNSLLPLNALTLGDAAGSWADEAEEGRPAVGWELDTGRPLPAPIIPLKP